MHERNIVWQNGKISYEDKCKLMGQKGLAVWFTGLSGAGKSTIAAEVEDLLFKQGLKTCLLDGDNIRHGINSDLVLNTELLTVGESAELVLGEIIDIMRKNQ